MRVWRLLLLMIAYLERIFDGPYFWLPILWLDIILHFTFRTVSGGLNQSVIVINNIIIVGGNAGTTRRPLNGTVCSSISGSNVIVIVEIIVVFVSMAG
jgi:hypothetical protein